MAILDLIELVLGLVDAGGLGTSIPLAGRADRWLRRQRSKSWPSAQATILSARVEQREGPCVLSAAYSFRVGEDRYGGNYKREFAGEWEAHDMLQRLQASPPAVRYKPGDPDKSILEDH